MPPGSVREAAWKVIDLTLVAIMAAAALLLLWLLPEWPLNDEVFYLLAIVAFALRQRAERKREIPATDGSDTGRTGASPRPLDWVLLLVLGAIMLLSVEGLLTQPSSLVERVFDALNTALAGLFAAYVVLSRRAQQHA